MKMNELRRLRTLAHAIGVSEAHEQKRIVPAAHSKSMMQFMREHDTGKRGCLLPLIKAYMDGVAEEINLQTREEM